MSRKVVRLTLDHLARSDSPCATCLSWQSGPGSAGAIEAAVADKEAWLSYVLREWGSCGQVLLVDERPAGCVVYAPAAYLPGTAAMPTAPPSPDAVVMAELWVDPAHRGGGLGRMLVQGMARDVSRRGIPAIEAFGRTTPDPRGCEVPAAFLGGVGFKTQRDHPTTPRMRMDLRNAIAWRSEMEAAWERLVDAMRPVQPAPGTQANLEVASPVR